MGNSKKPAAASLKKMGNRNSKDKENLVEDSKKTFLGHISILHTVAQVTETYPFEGWGV